LVAIQHPMLGIPLAFVAACASYQFVEKPCLKIGKRLLMRHTIQPRPNGSTLSPFPTAAENRHTD
jgi:peptidoglycan/LPS O-acetylase OafA/YrhL